MNNAIRVHDATTRVLAPRNSRPAGAVARLLPFVMIGVLAGCTAFPEEQEPPLSVIDEPPENAGEATQVFLYVDPKNGQSAEQQATDWDQCQHWAVNETGFDLPPAAGDPAAEQSAKRDAYVRALIECLQGRGYYVKMKSD